MILDLIVLSHSESPKGTGPSICITRHSYFNLGIRTKRRLTGVSGIKDNARHNANMWHYDTEFEWLNVQH